MFNKEIHTVEYCKNNLVAILVENSTEVEKIKEIANKTNDYIEIDGESYYTGHCITIKDSLKHGKLKWYVLNNFEIINALEFIKAHTPVLPEYKIGMWVTLPNSNYARRIVSFTDDRKYARDDEGQDLDLSDFLGIYQPCTKEQIFEHLKEEAIRKGYKAGIKIKRSVEFLQLYRSKSCVQIESLIDCNYDYDFSGDYFTLSGIAFYCKGIWAEILPNEVKVKLRNTIYICDKEAGIASSSDHTFTKQFLSKIIDYADNFEKDTTVPICSISIGILGELSISDLRDVYNNIK